MSRIFILVFFLTISVGQASEYNFSKDFKNTLGLFFSGSVEQFKQKSNLYYAGLAVPGLWYSFEHDDRIIDNAMTKDIPNHINLVGDFGVIFSFPILPLGLYYYGRNKKNDHLIRFSMEYAATLYLTLAETGLLSHIPIHARPNTKNLSFWETSFRGKSSFASGHIVPYAALFFKTLQFYGPYYSIAPLILTVMGSMQRVREGRHYLSDILGGFFLAAFASEGVRAAGGYKNNHPFYKLIFQNNVQVGFIRKNKTLGPRISFEF